MKILRKQKTFHLKGRETYKTWGIQKVFYQKGRKTEK